jgi:signal transduction histidine kinase
MDQDNIRVLLIEDNPGDARLVLEMLAEVADMRLEMEHAERLSAGLECLDEDAIDIVLSDLSLPDSRGLEAVVQVQALCPYVPIVVLTGQADESLGVQAIRLGAQDYLVKQEIHAGVLSRVIRYALERKRADEALRASEARFRKLIDNNADAVVVVDRDRSVRFANPAAELAFGVEAQDLVGEEFAFPLVVGQTTEIEIGRDGGQPNVAEMRVVETEWDSEPAYLASLRDVTERKRMLTELELANEELQRLNQIKSEFVATVSHELRTPLAIIKEAIGLVLDEIPGRIVGEQRGILETGQRNVGRLGRIIDSLLSISKIEHHGLQLEERVISASELVEDTVSDFSYLAERKGVYLDCELPSEDVIVRIDPDKAREVLVNLISNSLKFTLPGGRVRVVCWQEEGEVLVAVSDTGRGISKEDMPRLFEKFTQFGRQAGPGEQGTGLGLAICRGLVGLWGGRIWAESELGEGSRFTFTLPASRLERVAQTEPAEDGARINAETRQLASGDQTARARMLAS